MNRKKLLIHSCCAPCTIYPLEFLQEKDEYDIEILFYNPNIHPFTEYRNRLNSLKDLCEDYKIKLHLPEEYDLHTFFRDHKYDFNKRCTFCYSIRLNYLFDYSFKNNFDLVTTTLLYSKYQNHKILVTHLEKNSVHFNIPYLYHDFREGWQKGIDLSITKGLYRQKYCGCLYSEQERFDNRYKKRMRKN